MNVSAGVMDRRITFEVASETRDAAGDVLQAWSTAFKRWARKKDRAGREFFGADQMVRDADTVFLVRSDSDTRAVAPETHRIVYGGVTYEIVARADTDERKDGIEFICSSRPDRRGARAGVP